MLNKKALFIFIVLAFIIFISGCEEAKFSGDCVDPTEIEGGRITYQTYGNEVELCPGTYNLPNGLILANWVDEMVLDCNHAKLIGGGAGNSDYGIKIEAMEAVVRNCDISEYRNGIISEVRSKLNLNTNEIHNVDVGISGDLAYGSGEQSQILGNVIYEAGKGIKLEMTAVVEPPYYLCKPLSDPDCNPCNDDYSYPGDSFVIISGNYIHQVNDGIYLYDGGTIPCDRDDGTLFATMDSNSVDDAGSGLVLHANRGINVLMNSDQNSFCTSSFYDVDCGCSAEENCGIPDFPYNGRVQITGTYHAVDIRNTCEIIGNKLPCFGFRDCGNGQINLGENCYTCAADAGCGKNTVCCFKDNTYQCVAGTACATSDSECNYDSYCDYNENCECSDCYGERDNCGWFGGVMCIGGTCDCPEGYDYFCTGDRKCCDVACVDNRCPGEVPPVEYCGDGACNGDETCSTCPEDCGSCPPPPGDRACGDNPLWQNGCPKGYSCCDEGNGLECVVGLCTALNCGSNPLVCEDGDSCGCSECEGEPDSCMLGYKCVSGVCDPGEVPPISRCGDGYIDPVRNEECDFVNGVAIYNGLTCSDFDDYNDLGNLICNPVNSQDACRIDLGNCLPDIPVGSCGNNVINGDEQCDGNPWETPAGDWGDIDGCIDFGYDGGFLVCDNNCEFDVTQCGYIPTDSSWCDSDPCNEEIGEFCCDGGPFPYCSFMGCGMEECNNNVVKCENGEGCSCPDCYYERDGCPLGYFCGEGGFGCFEPPEDIPGGDEDCGNGILDSGEQCDDSNLINNDGCDSDCQYEGDPVDPNDDSFRECGNNRIDDAKDDYDFGDERDEYDEECDGSLKDYCEEQYEDGSTCLDENLENEDGDIIKYACQCFGDEDGNDPESCTGVKYSYDNNCVCDKSDGCPDGIGSMNKYRYQAYLVGSECKYRPLGDPEKVDCWLDSDEVIPFFGEMSIILTLLILIGYFVYTGRRRKL